MPLSSRKDRALPSAFLWWRICSTSAAPSQVRPIAIAGCDLDLYIATGFYRRRGPLAFGHEMVGEVIDAGEAAGVVPG